MSAFGPSIVPDPYEPWMVALGAGLIIGAIFWPFLDDWFNNGLRRRVFWRFRFFAPDFSTAGVKDAKWIELRKALRYIVEGSAWSYEVSMAPTDDLNDILESNFLEAAARGDIHCRGVPQNPSGHSGAAAATTVPIPPEFWAHAFIQPFAEMDFDDPKRGAATTVGKYAVSDRRAFREVIVDGGSLLATWPPASKRQRKAASPVSTAYLQSKANRGLGPNWAFAAEFEMLAAGG